MPKKILRFFGAAVLGIGMILVVLGMQGFVSDTLRIVGLVMLVIGSGIIFLDSFLSRKAQNMRWGDEEKLTNLEGIGPKINAILSDNSIRTYRDLASRTPEELTEMINAHGFSAPFDATSWPVQANLAAKSRWSDLEALQKSLRKKG